jgi:hypothetical protein
MTALARLPSAAARTNAIDWYRLLLPQPFGPTMILALFSGSWISAMER